MVDSTPIECVEDFKYPGSYVYAYVLKSGARLPLGLVNARGIRFEICPVKDMVIVSETAGSSWRITDQPKFCRLRGRRRTWALPS
jgi:hypothetical protein